MTIIVDNYNDHPNHDHDNDHPNHDNYNDQATCLQRQPGVHGRLSCLPVVGVIISISSSA